MGSVNFSGVGTGIDWSLIIEAEIQARTRQIITPLEEWKTDWETKLVVFDQLRSLLGDLNTACGAMDTPEELRSYTAASSSETTLLATVSSSATAGSYSVLVNQLARGEVEMHGGVDEAETVVNNSGAALDFSYSCGGVSTSVEVADGTTLEQLADLINNDPNNPGVTASVLDDGGGSATSHHLVLRSTDTGSTNTIAINAAATTLEGDWGTLTADAGAGTSALTVDDASPFQQYQAIIVEDDDSAAEYHIISSVAGNTLNLQGNLAANFTVAQNATTTPRGIGSGLAAAVGSGEDEVSVDDASQFQVGKTVIIADGANSEQVTISAVDTTNNTITFTTTLTNGYGADAYVTQLEGGRKFTFEDTDFTQTQSAQNAQLRLDGYPAGSWIEREDNVINDVIPGVTLTLLGSSGGSAVTVTVSESPAEVKAKIQDFIAAYNAVKEFLNETTSYDVDTEQAGTLLGNYAAEMVESMLRDIVINLAPGFLEGTDPYTHLRQVGIEGVGRTDDEFALGTLSLDETTLDEALADDFEGVIRLFAEDFGGYSDSTYLTFYQASDLLTTPGTYDVQVDFDGAGNITAARMKLSTESTYRDADIDSPYVVGASDNPEDNLWVKAVWDGVSATQTAQVRVTQGIAGALTDCLADILDTSDGLIYNIEDNYGDIISHIDTRIEQEEDRLELLRERLTAKYARLEQLLVELQGQQDWASAVAGNLGFVTS